MLKFIMCKIRNRFLTASFIPISCLLKWYLLKLENSDCFLSSHVFEISTKEHIENVLNKYNITFVNTRKLSKPAEKRLE